jgi:hypothetical protein
LVLHNVACHQAITVWRTERWVKDHEEQADREVEAREVSKQEVSWSH